MLTEGPHKYRKNNFVCVCIQTVLSNSSWASPWGHISQTCLCLNWRQLFCISSWLHLSACHRCLCAAVRGFVVEKLCFPVAVLSESSWEQAPQWLFTALLDKHSSVCCLQVRSGIPTWRWSSGHFKQGVVSRERPNLTGIFLNNNALFLLCVHYSTV